MWGAFGKPPTETPADTDKYYVTDPVAAKGPPPEHFNSPVHCVEIANDGLVYVCDRSNSRIQVFRRNGTFVREISFGQGDPNGGISDVALWPDAKQTYLFAGGRGIKVLDRTTGKVISHFADDLLLHMTLVDHQGNIYLGDVFKPLVRWAPSRAPR
jgi:hypothetical protein